MHFHHLNWLALLVRRTTMVVGFPVVLALLLRETWMSAMGTTEDKAKTQDDAEKGRDPLMPAPLSPALGRHSRWLCFCIWVRRKTYISVLWWGSMCGSGSWPPGSLTGLCL